MGKLGVRMTLSPLPPIFYPSALPKFAKPEELKHYERTRRNFQHARTPPKIG
jgi:hypothetical protein